MPSSCRVLPPATLAAWAQATGILPCIERGKTSPIPQWLADRTGWEPQQPTTSGPPATPTRNMRWRDGMPIFVARGAREPLSHYGPGLRHFD